MPGPQPPVDISNGCSVIDNATLYVYTPSAFVSLPLTENAKWNTLPSGVSTSNARCVKAVPNGDESQASLWIVGGTSSDSTYPGLQRYSFGNQSWETITPVTKVTQNRQGHGAAYLNATDSLVVYAGSQDGNTAASTQTFTISVFPPYNVLAFEAQAPPVTSPIMLPWDESNAVMLGGSDTNEEVWLFGSDTGWEPLGTNLTLPISSGQQCTLMAGSDGSKVLEIYDLSVTPNNITQVALLGAGGETVPNGQFVGQGGSFTSKQKRDLTLNDWPTYNSSGAPTATRTGASLTQGKTGMVVIAGGDSTDPIEMFNQASNTWINTTQFFGAADTQQSPLATPAVVTSSSSPVPTPSQTATAQGGIGDGQPKSRVLTVLGATLGAIFGVAALLIIILLLLRWCRRRKQDGRRSPFGRVGEKEDVDRLSFQDRGASFMREAGHSSEKLDKPFASEHKNGSLTSLAIITGKLNGHRRGLDGQHGSTNSTAPLVRNGAVAGGAAAAGAGAYEMHRFQNEKNAPAYRNGPSGIAPTAAGLAAADYANMHPGTRRSLGQHAAQAPPERSAGWSRYFAPGEQPTNLANLGPHSPGRSTFESGSTVTGEDLEGFRDSKSAYDGDTRSNSRQYGVAPLELGDTGGDFDSERVSKVVTGSPRVDAHPSSTAGRSAIYESTESTGSESDSKKFPLPPSGLPGNPTSAYSGAMGPGVLSDRIGWHAFTPSQERVPEQPHREGRARATSEALSSVYTTDSRTSHGSYIPRGESGPFFSSTGGKPSRPSTSRGEGHAADNARDSQREEEYAGRQRSHTVTGLRKSSSVYPASLSVAPGLPRPYPNTEVPVPAGAANPSAGLRAPGASGADERASTQTVWPGPGEHAVLRGHPDQIGQNTIITAGGGRRVGNDDMSWLNLGQR